MNQEQIKQAILESLSAVAPEADIGAVSRTADLRDSLDLDSMDFLRYLTKLHQVTGVEVPERDYPMLRTVEGAESYLARRLDRPS